MENRKVHGINLIRILSMSMILLFHARLLYGFRIGIEPIDNIFSIGAICVTVFFMLSGYGLRKGHRKLDTSSLGTYLKRRLLSIYPLYLLLQVVAVLFSFRMNGFEDVWTWLVPVQLTMTQVLVGPEVYGYLFNDNCWYISALFILYLLFPVLNASMNWVHRRIDILDSRRRNLLWIAFIVVMLLVSEGNYLYQIYGVENNSFLNYYPNPFFRIPEFCIGMLAADLSEDDRIMNWFRSGLHGVTALVCCFGIGFIGLQILYPYVGLEYNLYNIIVVPCTVITILCVAGSECLHHVGSSKVARWIAGMGLEMYLCQSFAILVIERVGISSYHGLWFIGLSVVIAEVVHVGFTKLRRAGQ